MLVCHTWCYLFWNERRLNDGRVTDNVSVEKATEVLSSVLENWVQTVSLQSLRKN